MLLFFSQQKNIPKNSMLISSVVPCSPIDNEEEDRSNHVITVDKLIRVLTNSSSADHAMEDSLSVVSGSSVELDDDMLLSQFQNEAKMEDLARRGPSKSGTKPKKGRKSPNSETFFPSFYFSIFRYMTFMNLKILTWNYRGISNPRLNSRIRDCMARLKLNFLCLVETKANAPIILCFCRQYHRWWDWAAIPFNSLSGRILVLWNKAVGNITPVASSRTVLHLVITSAKNLGSFYYLQLSSPLRAEDSLEISQGFLFAQHPVAPHRWFQWHHLLWGA